MGPMKSACIGAGAGTGDDGVEPKWRARAATTLLASVSGVVKESGRLPSASALRSRSAFFLRCSSNPPGRFAYTSITAALTVYARRSLEKIRHGLAGAIRLALNSSSVKLLSDPSGQLP